MSDMPTSAETKPLPILPRRAFLAATLSALVAGGAVGLALLGGASTVASRDFTFSRGTGFASGQEDALRGFIAQAMADDRIHVTIQGHSGTSGDAAANLALSQARADRAAEIASSLGISPERMTVAGLGGGAPLTKEDGESDRAFQSRLARVTVALQVRK